MHYEIMHIESGELTGHFINLSQAKAEADRLCDVNDRKEHFNVVKIEIVWITQTLDEALKK